MIASPQTKYHPGRRRHGDEPARLRLGHARCAGFATPRHLRHASARTDAKDLEGHVVNQESLIAALNLVGRVLLVAIFLPEAWVKLRGYDNVLEYMEQYGVPGLLLPLVIAVEIAAPVMIILGWYTRLAAFVLAGFCLLTGLFFHTDFDDLNQVLHFWKNLAMAGGFIVVMANGAGAWSLDERPGKRNTANPTS
jgi:putative oxidoreductase